MVRSIRKSQRRTVLREVQYVECRTLGHAWKYTRVTAVESEFVQHLQCTRCRSDKHQHLDHEGFIISSSYTYSEDYLVSGIGRLDKGDRAVLRKRAMDTSQVPFEVVEEHTPRTRRKR